MGTLTGPQLTAAITVTCFLIGVPIGWLSFKHYHLWRHRRR